MANEIDLYRSQESGEWQLVDDKPRLRGLTRAVIGLGVGVFGGFLLWANYAVIESAAQAPGVVVVESHRKTIQSLNGGIVKKLLVRDGDVVKANQVVIELDETQARAAFAIVQQQYAFAQAQLARLRAELEGAAEISFPPELLKAASTSAEIKAVIAHQRVQFDARRTAYEGQKAVLNQQIAELQETIKSSRSVKTAAEEQLKYINEEIDSVEKLLEKGLERKPRLLALQRAASDLKGKAGEQAGVMATATETIQSTRLKIADLGNQRRSEITTQMEQTQQSLTDAAEKVTAASDVLNRQQITAPLAGKVVALNVFTVGGVIRPGDPIMDIVPEDDSLIIDSRVSMNDIDTVRPGLPAEVMLMSYKRRQTPTVPGQVVNVSADLLTDQRTGNGYYSARIVLEAKELASLHDVELYPGMPVQAMILTGSRTALDYIIGPLFDSFHTAFRED